MTDDAGVRIRLLGGFEVTVADRPVAADAWRLRKAKTLVKLLALARGHRLHREALVAVLWPDRDEASATNNLHQALYVARRVLAGTPDALCGLRDDVVWLSEGAMPWLDTDAFDAACRRARHTRDPEDYRVAAALYRGDLLPEDRFEEWAEGPREALRERHLGLLVEYAGVLTGRDEHAQVVDIVGAVTAADPFHEGAYRMLMAALAASGRRYEALAALIGSGRRWRRSMPPTPSRQPGGSTGSCCGPRTPPRKTPRRSGWWPRRGRSRPERRAPRTVCGRSRPPLSGAGESSPRSTGRLAAPDCSP